MTCFIKEILSWSSLNISLSRELSASQRLCVNDYEIVQIHWGQCSFSNLLSLIRESGFYRLILSDLGHFPLGTDCHPTAENLKWFLNQWWDRVTRWVCSTYREQVKYIFKIIVLAVKKNKKPWSLFSISEGIYKAEAKSDQAAHIHLPGLRKPTGILGTTDSVATRNSPRQIPSLALL